MVLSIDGFFENNREFINTIIAVSTLVITLATLVITSILNYKSAKSSERSAEAAERSAKSSEESANSAEKSSNASIESVKLTADSIKIAERASQIAAQTFQVQREHNIKSVTPILLINQLNHDEEVSVNLINNGIGPLLVKKILITDGVENTDNLISWMPVHPDGRTYWKTYRTGYLGMSIYPGTSVPLILLANENENKIDYVLFRAFVRRNLSRLVMTVEYEDIYNQYKEPQTINLKWFGKLGMNWFQDNYPKHFVNFNLTLKSALFLCSPQEWDEMIGKMNRSYSPNSNLNSSPNSNLNPEQAKPTF